MGMRPNTLAARVSARYFLIAAICVITATACGSVAAPGAGGGAIAKPAPKGSLELTVTSHPGAVPVHWTLRCDPAGGTHPDPAAACRALLAVKDPFAPLPKHIMCPMIQVGAKTATVTGRWFGKNVNLTLTDGGCSLGRWIEFGKIFN
jgi:hypothetical protein